MMIALDMKTRFRARERDGNVPTTGDPIITFLGQLSQGAPRTSLLRNKLAVH